MPLFLDDPGAGGSLVYGDDGLPTQNGTAEYPVLIHVPTAAYDAPAKLMAYGHGMLGSRFEILADHLEAICADGNVIVFATDWVGMSEDDVNNIVGILSLGALDNFHTVPDRLMQGFLNGFAAMRLLQGKLGDDPTFDGVQIDPQEPWYFGGSQGGIFGSNYMALSPDVLRGMLAVPGQPYSLLLNRSVNFAQFFALIDSTYPDKLDLRFMIELVQLEWDRAEPASGPCGASPSGRGACQRSRLVPARSRASASATETSRTSCRTSGSAGEVAAMARTSATRGVSASTAVSTTGALP